MIRRLFASIMASSPSPVSVAAATTKMVPIPKNGVDYRGKIVLAPMVRSGELPMRLISLKYGADLVWGPETIDRAIIGTTRRFNSTTKTLEWYRYSSNVNASSPDARESILYRIHPELEKGKLIYQMGSANPKLAVEAAKIVAADVNGIDLNCGCPKPFSTNGGMGAALLSTPDLLCDILTSLVEEVGKPFEIGISCKIRLLGSPEETATLVKRLVNTGITGLTVHCRTRNMRPREKAIREQLAMVGEICREAGVACLMNGDVNSRDEALALAKEFGVDGGMIARAAESNPSCFRTEADGGKAKWEEVVRHYMEYALSIENRWGNTKFTLGQLVPGKLPVYRALTGAKGYLEAVQALNFDENEEMEKEARRVDETLELGEFRKKIFHKREKEHPEMEEVKSKKAKKNHEEVVVKEREILAEREDEGNIAMHG